MAKDNKDVKFTEDEMKSLTELQQTYAGVQQALGGISVQRMRVEQQLADVNSAEAQLKSQFADTQTKEREFVQEINKKYGDGNLNLESGVFTPRPAEETPDKTL